MKKKIPLLLSWWVLRWDYNYWDRGGCYPSRPYFCFVAFKLCMGGIGHCEVTSKAGSVLCRSALWDCFEVASSYFIGYYGVALENGSKIVLQNSPTMQFDTTPAQSFAEPPKSPITGSWLFVFITARWIRICRSPCRSFNTSGHE